MAGPEIVALGGALEGAERTSRETMLWDADRRHPDQIIHQVKDEADFRGRDMVTNDGYAQGVVNLNRDSIVGHQFVLNAMPNWPVLQRMYSSRFDEVWADEFQTTIEEVFNLVAESNACWLDASRRLTFTALVRLAVAGFTFTGEVLATAEWIREVGRPFNTAVQVIAPTRLSNPDGMPDDRNLRRGIRRDSRGKPVGYYIRAAYPTEWYYNYDNYSWLFVPAEKPWGRRMVIHITDVIQPDQSRGVSNLVAVLKQMRMTKKFNEITLQNAVINASYAATIESELPRDVVAAMLGAGSTTDDPTSAFMNLLGGYLQGIQQYTGSSNTLAVDGAKIPQLFPGTTLNLKTLGTPGGIGTDFEVSLLRHIAAGLGISYEEFARDFSRVTYSSARAAMILTTKHMTALKKFVADRFADEVYALFLEEFLNIGQLPLPRGFNSSIFYEPFGKDSLTACEWIGSARGQIDELKETQAAMLRIKAGLSSHQQEVARFGGDWRKLFRQISREQKLANELGLVIQLDAQKDQTAGGQTVMTDSVGSGTRQEAPEIPDSDPGFTKEDLTEAFSSALRKSFPQPSPQSPPRRERTVVTKHDAQGRILEFERYEVE